MVKESGFTLVAACCRNLGSVWGGRAKLFLLLEFLLKKTWTILYETTFNSKLSGNEVYYTA